MIHITVVGDGFVGKTTLLYRFKDDKVPFGYEPTVFENYSMQMIVDGREHQVQLWDTAGQEGYDRLRTLAYRTTTCCVVCFAVDIRSSFTNIKDIWIKEIKSGKRKSLPVILVGTKSDLKDEGKEGNFVGAKEALEMKKKIKAIEYIECSAINGKNVKEVFEAAVKASIRAGNKKQNCTLL